MDIRIKCPFVMEVCGPSQSGKSEWVGKLIRYQLELLEHPAKAIFWCSPHGHLPSNLSEVDDVPIHSIKGLPWGAGGDISGIIRQYADSEKDEKRKGKPPHLLIIIDDFAQENKNSKELTELYTKGSHHNNISIIQIMQNIFWSGSDSRTRSLNAHYMVLMRQQRDLQQIRRLSRQVTDSEANHKAFLDSYKAATGQRQYSYMFISFHPRDDTDLLLRANIFPGEKPKLLFKPIPPPPPPIGKYKGSIFNTTSFNIKEEDSSDDDHNLL